MIGWRGSRCFFYTLQLAGDARTVPEHQISLIYSSGLEGYSTYCSSAHTSGDSHTRARLTSAKSVAQYRAVRSAITGVSRTTNSASGEAWQTPPVVFSDDRANAMLSSPRSISAHTRQNSTHTAKVRLT